MFQRLSRAAGAVADCSDAVCLMCCFSSDGIDQVSAIFNRHAVCIILSAVAPIGMPCLSGLSNGHFRSSRHGNVHATGQHVGVGSKFWMLGLVEVDYFFDTMPDLLAVNMRSVISVVAAVAAILPRLGIELLLVY